MSTPKDDVERSSAKGTGSLKNGGQTATGTHKRGEADDGREVDSFPSLSTQDPIVSPVDARDVARSENVEQQEEAEQDETYPQPDEDQALLPPPDFKPFFTIVDEETGEHHHPTVHYVFPDDDQDILSNAILETYGTSNEQGMANERLVIIDLSSDGKSVVAVSPLSPDWQALRTTIGPAPSWSGDDGQSASRGLMLRILGQESKQEGDDKDEEKNRSIEALLRTFDERMCTLDEVLRTADDDEETPR